MPTFTTNYDLAKPLVNNAVDQDLWGTELNGDLDIIDSQLLVASNFVTRDITTNDSSTTADSKKLLLCDATGGGLSVSLPLVADAGNGFTIAIKKTDNSANVVTISSASSIDGATTYLLSKQWDAVVLVCNGSTWRVLSTSTQVSDATTSVKGVIQIATDSEALAGTDTAKAVTSSGLASVKSYSTNGYQKLPGGLIIQWGTTTSQTVTFPIAFPTACLNVNVNPSFNSNAAIASSYSFVTSTSTTNFVSPNADGITKYWQAIGY